MMMIGTYKGFDENEMTSRDGGKPKVVQKVHHHHHHYHHHHRHRHHHHHHHHYHDYYYYH